MKKINSRSKGAAGEVELAHFLSDRGYPARRGQQFSGGSESPDVVCPDLVGWHVEAKRVEAGNPYVWLAQAIKDAGSKTPVVMHRRNGKEWVAILRLEDFLTQFLFIGSRKET